MVQKLLALVAISVAAACVPEDELDQTCGVACRGYPREACAEYDGSFCIKACSQAWEDHHDRCDSEFYHWSKCMSGVPLSGRVCTAASLRAQPGNCDEEQAAIEFCIGATMP